jgi:hypothetical protein
MFRLCGSHVHVGATWVHCPCCIVYCASCDNLSVCFSACHENEALARTQDLNNRPSVHRSDMRRVRNSKSTNLTTLLASYDKSCCIQSASRPWITREQRCKHLRWGRTRTTTSISGTTTSLTYPEATADPSLGQGEQQMNQMDEHSNCNP